MASSPSATPSGPARGAPKVDFMSDEDLEKDWKPNARRPQSTIARSFSAELEDIFRIDNSVADLDAKLDERKQVVQTAASELEALEQRIRDMEQRLKSGGKQPAPQASIPERRAVAQQTSTSTLVAPAAAAAAADASQKHGGSRPGTAKASQQAVPGALPPTPTASEGEYEFVPDPFTTSFGPEYPRYRHQLLLPRMTTTTTTTTTTTGGGGGGGFNSTGSSSGGSGGAGSGSAQELRSQHYHQQHYQHQSILNNSHPLNQHHMSGFSKPPPPHDARSIKSVRTIGSESGSADFVIVPGPDGDGEQDH